MNNTVTSLNKHLRLIKMCCYITSSIDTVFRINIKKINVKHKKMSYKFMTDFKLRIRKSCQLPTSSYIWPLVALQRLIREYCFKEVENRYVGQVRLLAECTPVLGAELAPV